MGKRAFLLTLTGAASEAARVSGLLPRILRTSLISPLLSACARLSLSLLNRVPLSRSSVAVEVRTLRMLVNASPAVWVVVSKSFSVESSVSDPLSNVVLTLVMESVSEVICGLSSFV